MPVKLNLSWRRVSYRPADDRGIMPACDLFVEQRELDALQAAINLTPDEIMGQLPSKHEASLTLVLSRISAAELPDRVASALVSRAAQHAMEKKDARMVFNIAWAWGAVDSTFVASCQKFDPSVQAATSRPPRDV